MRHPLDEYIFGRGAYCVSCQTVDMDALLRSLMARVGLDEKRWRVADLKHNRWATPGIWSLSDGTCSVVMKWLSATHDSGPTIWDRHWTTDSHKPTRWTYWVREALAYRDGLVESFTDDGLHAPACIALDIAGNDAVIVLEFVDGRVQPVIATAAV